MILITCIAIFIAWLQGKDVKSLLEKLKNVDWKKHASKLFTKIKKHANTIERFACSCALKLWFVLVDSKTTNMERALICGGILYIISKGSIIPASIYKLLGLADEGLAAGLVIDKVRDKITPAIENKVNDVLDDWFGPVYTINDVKA